jgi:sec-independent protein translocase protein TatA
MFEFSPCLGDRRAEESAGGTSPALLPVITRRTITQWTLGEIMFEGLFQPMHLLIVAGIALLVFGPKKLPELGKGLGESIRGFKSAMSEKEKPAAPQSEPGAGRES